MDNVHPATSWSASPVRPKGRLFAGIGLLALALLIVFGAFGVSGLPVNAVTAASSFDRPMSFLVATALIVLTGLSRRLFGTWFQPGPFFALFWSLEVTLPLVFDTADDVSPLAVLLILGAVLCVIVGNLAVVDPNRRFPGSQSTTLRTSLPVLASGAVLCICLGMLAPLLDLHGFGYGFGILLSPVGLVQVAHAISVYRYQHAVYTGVSTGQALLTFVYAAAIFGGALAGLGGRGRYRAISLISLLPAICITVIETERAATIISCYFWIGGYLAVRMASGNETLFTARRFVLAAIVGLIGTALFALVLLARAGVPNLALIPTDVLPSLVVDLLGFLPVFSSWVTSSAFASADPSWGVLTFSGPFSLLGHQRLGGLYLMTVPLASGFTSNIYTVFRPLVDDFTLAGAAAALFAFGAATGSAYRLMRTGRIAFLPLLIAAYTTTLYSTITDLWTYNSNIAALLLFWAFWCFALVAARRRLATGDDDRLKDRASSQVDADATGSSRR